MTAVSRARLGPLMNHLMARPTASTCMHSCKSSLNMQEQHGQVVPIMTYTCSQPACVIIACQQKLYRSSVVNTCSFAHCSACPCMCLQPCGHCATAAGRHMLHHHSTEFLLHQVPWTQVTHCVTQHNAHMLGRCTCPRSCCRVACMRDPSRSAPALA